MSHWEDHDEEAPQPGLFPDNDEDECPEAEQQPPAPLPAAGGQGL